MCVGGGGCHFYPVAHFVLSVALMFDKMFSIILNTATSLLLTFSVKSELKTISNELIFRGHRRILRALLQTAPPPPGGSVAAWQSRGSKPQPNLSASSGGTETGRI